MDILTIILIIISILFLSTIIFLYIALKKSMQRNTVFENHFITMANILAFVQQKLYQIDESGAFASDDEVGFAFKTIKDVWKILIDAGIRTIDEKGSSSPPEESNFQFPNGNKQVM